jgi:hypothetical protein
MASNRAKNVLTLLRCDVSLTVEKIKYQSIRYLKDGLEHWLKAIVRSTESY